MNNLTETLMNEALNRYYKEIKLANPQLSDKEILQIAAGRAITEQRALDAELKIKSDIKFATLPEDDGEVIRKVAEDGVLIKRVSNQWRQKKGSKISDDGFFKEGYDTVTMPKEIDITTSEGDKKAGKFVKELKAAKKREDKMKHEMEKQQWEDRTIQVTVNKENT
jgi:hypothetical protein